ncbi:hypothetical protein C8J57DRAFT_1501357 [Mycena rebaudengoi]|nr:hypothetical protein C8J57DRAFT_1501357 [Mycena rebaudengoi]
MTFPTHAGAEQFIKTAQEIYNFYGHLLFGAGVGLTHTEVDRRVNPSLYYHGFTSLKYLVGNEVKANEMDFACASYITRHAQRLLFTTYNGHEPADQFLRCFLQGGGMSMEELDQAILDKGDVIGAWDIV